MEFQGQFRLAKRGFMATDVRQMGTISLSRIILSVIGMDFYMYATLSPSRKFKWDTNRFGV